MTTSKEYDAPAQKRALFAIIPIMKNAMVKCAIILILKYWNAQFAGLYFYLLLIIFMIISMKILKCTIQAQTLKLMCGQKQQHLMMNGDSEYIQK